MVAEANNRLSYDTSNQSSAQSGGGKRARDVQGDKGYLPAVSDYRSDLSRVTARAPQKSGDDLALHSKRQRLENSQQKFILGLIKLPSHNRD